MFVTSRIIFALVALSVSSRTLVAEEIPLRGPGAAGLAFELKPEKITPGERARLTVALPLASVGLADVDEETELPTLRDDLLLETEELQVLERDFRRERDHLVWTFDVTAHKDGKYNLPPLEVKFGGQTFSTEAVPLVVKANRAPGDETLRPDFDGVGKPWPWVWWLGGVLLLVALVLVWRRSGHQRRLVGRLASRSWQRFLRWLAEPTPEATLRYEIETCRDALSRGEPAGALVDRATRAVRWYLATRKETAANAWTTDELKLHEVLRLPELEAAFGAADAMKFSGTESDARLVAERLLTAASVALAGRRQELEARADSLGRTLRRWLHRRRLSKPGSAR